MDAWLESAGLGHVIRQINLARALRAAQPDIAIQFFTDGNPAIIRRLRSAGEQTNVISSKPELAVEEIQQRWSDDPPALFLLDSATLHHSHAVRELVAGTRAKTACIVDEIIPGSFSADLVVNALPGESVSTGTGGVLRGPQFMIQDPDVALCHDMPKNTPARPAKGFAFFGGMDGNDYSSIFVQAIGDTDTGIEWTLLVGPLYVGFEALSAQIARNDLPVTVKREVPSVAHELWIADIAVIAAGNTLSEAVGVGTPCLCLAQTDEQSHNARYFSDRTGAVFVGGAGQTFPYPTSQPGVLFEGRAHAASLLVSALTELAANKAERSIIRQRMLAVIDGRGAERVASILLGMIPA